MDAARKPPRIEPGSPQRRMPAPFGSGVALAMLAGVLVVHALPRLPPVALSIFVLLVALPALALARLRLIAACAFGFAWCALRADVALERRLPHALEGRDLDVVGVVDDLPRRRVDAVRMQLRVEQASDGGVPVDLRGSVRLTWYGSAVPEPGACTRWQLRVRLKRPRAMVNPGGFDAERHALERGIVANGYVREADGNRQVGEGGAVCVGRWRARIADGIQARVGDPHAAALLRALTVGDTRALDDADWDLARTTGISHLLSISGFHVGIAALFLAFLLRPFWWVRPRLGTRLPLPLAQAPAALIGAASYGALAGASLPTVRTVLMIGVVVLARFGRRAPGVFQSLMLALLAVLVADPLATLAPGFWLSFVGVALLVAYLARRQRGLAGSLRELLSSQWVMSLALLPLTVWFFGQASLVGAVANLLAVPLVTLAIVPLGLLAAVALLAAPSLAAAPLALAASLVRLLWQALEWLAQVPGAQWHLPEPSPWALVLALVGAGWALLPRGVPLRGIAPVLFLPLLLPPSSAPPPGTFDARVIDVGQGLSVLVRTHSHALLFDAGAAYPSGFDVGAAAVLPTLRALGVRALDVLVVSHGDNDHAGGAVAVARAFPDARRLSGEPARLPLPSEPCRTGLRWRWDGVEFAFVWPDVDDPRARDNDASCVLRVANAAGQLLLTGDIGRRVEPVVAARVDAEPPLVLVAPHHGSRTSSSAQFLAMLAPREAIVSAAWRSRFGHPHPDVVARYASAGIPLHGTAESGALAIRFPADAPPRAPVAERARRARHWRE